MVRAIIKLTPICLTMKNGLKDGMEDKNIPKNPCDRIAAFVSQEITRQLKAYF